MTAAIYLDNDPLSHLNTREIWNDCVWFSNETTGMKLFLLAIGRFFDKEGRASSRAVSQVAQDCSAHPDTIRSYIKRARQYWLDIEVQGGFMTRFGRQNLYHAILPPMVLEGLRRYRAQQQEHARQKAMKPIANPRSEGVVVRLRQVNENYHHR